MSGHLSHLIGPKIRVALDNRNSWWRGSGAGVAEFFVIVRLPSWTPGTSHDGLRGTQTDFFPFLFWRREGTSVPSGKACPLTIPSLAPEELQQGSLSQLHPHLL